MSLRAYSNRFLMLHNHTGMVVLRAFQSCWRLFAFDQIQLDACYAVVWRLFEATFKLRPIIPIFERNVLTECPWKPRQPTSIGIIWHIQPFSMQYLVLVFLFRSCTSSRFSFHGAVSSMRTLFFESDHATMFGRFYVGIMWTGNCRDVLRSTVTSSIQYLHIGIFCFLTGHSPSWILGFLAVTGCWFTVSHCARNNFMTTSYTLLCYRVHIWSDCGHGDSIHMKL